jgi:AraC-like DNA-binding protein
MASDPRVTSAVEHMQRCMAQRIEPAALAQRANLSPSRFRHLFALETGLGPARYLQRLRLRHARVLIERTFLNVDEVMTLVGYHDPQRFARDFRRCHGVPPGALRGWSAATPLPGDGNAAAASEPSPPAKSRTSRRVAGMKTRDPSMRFLMLRELLLDDPDRAPISRNNLFQMTPRRRGCI